MAARPLGSFSLQDGLLDSEQDHGQPGCINRTIRYFRWVTLQFVGNSVDFVVEGDGISFGRLCFEANGGGIAGDACKSAVFIRWPEFQSTDHLEEQFGISGSWPPVK
ncbi:hypothetical protein OIU74_000963 [Salix koriyanagi]|uniref:Uncharacterized protein n=1 Tax=Salix koriyanagi TaxID=2511006 RepID=A0A9Q0X1C2_9ROSI|nr:hypothetical protein OIU74_000963 [Salix koriyanagi]